MRQVVGQGLAAEPVGQVLGMRLCECVALQCGQRRHVQSDALAGIQILELQASKHGGHRGVGREHREVKAWLLDQLQEQANAVPAMTVEHTPTVRIAEPLDATIDQLIGINGAENADQLLVVVQLHAVVGAVL